MLKALKWIIALLGLAGLGVAIYYLVQTAWDMKEIMGAVEATRSRPYDNPMRKIYLVAGVAAAAGLLLGLGLGMPTRTAGGIRKQALAEVAERDSITRPTSDSRAHHLADERHAAHDAPKAHDKPATREAEPAPVVRDEEPRPASVNPVAGTTAPMPAADVAPQQRPTSNPDIAPAPQQPPRDLTQTPKHPEA